MRKYCTCTLIAFWTQAVICPMLYVMDAYTAYTPRVATQLPHGTWQGIANIFPFRTQGWDHPQCGLMQQKSSNNLRGFSSFYWEHF